MDPNRIHTALVLLVLLSTITSALQTLNMEPKRTENEVTVKEVQPKKVKNPDVHYFKLGKAENSAALIDEVDENPAYERLIDNRLFEGDIENVNASHLVSRNLTSVLSYFMSWPNGQVPYTISSSFSSGERRTIRQGMKQFHRGTCVRFTRRRNEFSYVFIQPGNFGCSSNVGRTGGAQKVNLGDGCVHPGIVVHELMHTIGFFHEQSRPDRDDYVVVNWKNIVPGMESNFLRFPHGLADTLRLPYDLGSIMHYGPFAFARDSRRPTLSIRHRLGNETRGATMGQLRGLSKLDIRKINKLYGCRKRHRCRILFL